MHPGDHGFAVAKFSAFEDHPAEQKQTEIPNLLLQEHFVGKKPAMRMKRPAAVLQADKSPASGHSEEGSGSGEEKKTWPPYPEPAAAVAPVDMGYSIMTYASTGAVAIRETKLGTAVSNSKSQKIQCSTQRHFGESKAKTFER